MSKQENKDCREVAYQAGFDEGFEKAFAIFDFDRQVNLRKLLVNYVCKYLFVDEIEEVTDRTFNRRNIETLVSTEEIPISVDLLKVFIINIFIDGYKKNRLAINHKAQYIGSIEFGETIDGYAMDVHLESLAEEDCYEV